MLDERRIAVEREKFPVVGEGGICGQEAFHHFEVLLKARDSHSGRVVLEAGLDVFALCPTRADAKLQAAPSSPAVVWGGTSSTASRCRTIHACSWRRRLQTDPAGCSTSCTAG